jgi:uncharacterized protein
MEAIEVLALLAFGLAGGIAGGVMGVGGGILFVPALVLFADQTQLAAESTSLVAVVLVGLGGMWRQHGYGNVRLRDGLTIGLLSPIGALAGVVLANAVPDRALELAFAAVALYFVYVFARRAIAPTPATAPRTPGDTGESE